MGVEVFHQAQSICQACGLCCRGVWFSHVELEAGEVDPARRVGLALKRVDETVSFQQPCVLHRNNCCSAYDDWRPRKCVEYSCRLLDRFLAGDVGLDEALTHVKSVRAMADRVQEEVGGLGGGLRGDDFLAKLLDSPDAEAAGRPALSPVTRLDAVALRIYYKKYFKKNAA